MEPREPLLTYTLVGGGVFLAIGAALWLLRFEAALRPYKTWFVLLPPIFLGWWLGPIGWAVFVFGVSLAAFREFAHATGLYREGAFTWLVVAAALACNLLALLAQWPLFMAVPVWTVALLTLVPIALNRTEGMLQAFALAVVATVFFAFFLAHLTYLAQAYSGLGLVIYVVLATQLNDALAFLSGKKLGRHRWTTLSPNKTVEGSLFALVATVVIAFLNWPLAFPHLPWWGVLLTGLVVSIGGQIGDLTMANVKRNVGIKDFGTLLPGHGGILDRANSLTLVAPIVFHLHNYLFQAFPDGVLRFP